MIVSLCRQMAVIHQGIKKPVGFGVLCKAAICKDAVKLGGTASISRPKGARDFLFWLIIFKGGRCNDKRELLYNHTDLLPQ